jgi:Glycosyl transferase family 2
MYTASHIDRVVVSLTTLPDRYEKLKETIESLLNQTCKPDAIYLGLPQVAKRLNKPYPPFSNANVKVVKLDDDYGPICKLVGGLLSESDPNTIIITVDDDTLYKPDFIEKMVEKANLFPNAVVCGTGARLGRGLMLMSIVNSLDNVKTWNGVLGFECEDKLGGLVDVAYGVGGVGYRRKFFPSKQNLFSSFVNLGQDKHNLFRQDDIFISGYLSKQKIQIRVFTDIPTVTTTIGGDDCITPDMDTMMKGISGAIEEGKEFGFFETMQPLPIDNSMAGKMGLGFFYFAMLLALAFAVWVIT